MSFRYVFHPSKQEFALVDCAPLTATISEQIFTLTNPDDTNNRSEPIYPVKCLFLCIDRTLILIPGAFTDNIGSRPLPQCSTELQKLVLSRYVDLHRAQNKLCIDRTSWQLLGGAGEAYDLLRQQSVGAIQHHWNHYQEFEGLYNTHGVKFYARVALVSSGISYIITPLLQYSGILSITALTVLCMIMFNVTKTLLRSQENMNSFKRLSRTARTPKEVAKRIAPLYRHCALSTGNNRINGCSFDELYQRVCSESASKHEIKSLMELMFSTISQFKQKTAR